MSAIFRFFEARLEPRIESDFVERQDRAFAIQFADALQARDHMFSAENHLRSHNSDEPKAIYLAQKYSSRLLDRYGKPPGVYVHCFALLKYGVGGGMAVHTDRMDAECCDCVLSAVMYLNDEYEGGEITFPKIRKSYHPRPGACISYPTLWPAYDHGVNTVTAGTRYVMAWCFTTNADRAFKPYLP